MPPPSNIRVSVHWKQPTVFAGEEVECTIIFKNVASSSGAEGALPQWGHHNAILASENRRRKLPQLYAQSRASASRKSSFGSQITEQHARGHRAALSLNSLNTPSYSNGHAIVPGSGDGTNTSAAETRPGRSLSIRSAGPDVANGNQFLRGPTEARRPGNGHSRASSLQVMPRRGSSGAIHGDSNLQDSTDTASKKRTSTSHLPVLGPSTPTIDEGDNEFVPPLHSGRQPSGQSTASNTPSFSSTSRQPSATLQNQYKFPGTPTLDTSTAPRQDTAASSRAPTSHLRTHSPRPPEQESRPGRADIANPVARMLSRSSMDGNSRSSIDVYSQSNNSAETLASEYPSHPISRPLPGPSHARQTSNAPTSQPRQYQPETLMMGYAQIVGSFSIDGSLVNQAPFEEVKRRGVVGGTGGGGVVGVERTSKRPGGGLFGSFGWGNIGESLSGLLNANEPSSIREMKSIA
ncbi:hypothetical protein LTS18_009682, partial [Coniosporium uncinatum]